MTSEVPLKCGRDGSVVLLVGKFSENSLQGEKADKKKDSRGDIS